MRGKLTETPFADTARRLSNEGVTGALEVTGAPGVARVFFRAGAVYWAMSPAPRARLGDRLVNAGFITQEQLDQALEVQQQSDQRTKLGALLVEEGLVGRDVIRVFVQEQILDALFDLVRWEDGDWVFHTGDAVEDKLPIDVPISQLLVEVSRRQSEWDQIQRTIPTLDAVPDHVIGGNATTAALEQDEFTMLASIDGSRSVRELAADLGYSEFEAGRIVYGLTLLGIVEISREAAAPEAPSTDEPATDAPEATAVETAETQVPDEQPEPDADGGDEDLDVGEALEHALFGESEPEPEQDNGLQVTVHFALEDDEPAAASVQPADEPEVHTPTAEAGEDEPGIASFSVEPTDDTTDEPEVHTPAREAPAEPDEDEPAIASFSIGDDTTDEPEVHTPGREAPAEPDEDEPTLASFSIGDDTTDEPEVHTPTPEPAEQPTDEVGIAGFSVTDDTTDEPEVHTPTTEPAEDTIDEPEVHTPTPEPTDDGAGAGPGIETPAASAPASSTATAGGAWDSGGASWDADDAGEVEDEPEPWVFTTEDFDAELGPAEDDAAASPAASSEAPETPATQDDLTTFDATAARPEITGVGDEGGTSDQGVGAGDVTADAAEISEDLDALVADITGADEDEPGAPTQTPAAAAEPSSPPPPPPGSSAPGAPPPGSSAPAAADQGASAPPARGRGDVSEFLRELTQLSTEDEEEGEDGEAAASDRPRRAKREAEDEGEDQKDDKKKKGGLFGWGR